MTSQYHEPTVVELKHFYALRNEPQIIEFLETKLTLYDFLREVPVIVHNYFPDETLVLELIFYPDEPESKKLFIYIQTTQDMNDAIATLNHLTRDYWINLDFAIRRAVVIDVECL